MSDPEELSRKRARRFFEFKKLTLPVDIEKILSEYAEVRYDFFPSDGDAICIIQKDKPMIILNEDVTERRKRFTLAHELGHIQIPWHTGMVFCHTGEDKTFDSTKYYQMEKEANAFAAELLMPKNWINTLIEKNENQDLGEIVNVICEKANVSFSAAVYNLINALPWGYVFFIFNKMDNYSQKKITGNLTQPLFLFYDNYKIDFKWIEFNSYNYGEIKNDLLEAFWFKYLEIINESVIDKSIKKISQNYNLTNVLSEIIDSENYSTAFTIKMLIDKLPPGYIIKLTFTPTKTFYYLTSKETYINPRGINDLDLWYNEYCQITDVYKESKIIIRWWYFKTSFNFQLNADDTRESKIILRNIIELRCEEERRKRIYGMINGIFGSLNNSRKELNPERFYNIVKQKFIGNEELEFITSHSDFNQYLVKKTLELYGK